ncbi:hypothetical protein SAMN02745221_01555 [Thermosyntropha lipolytica DSM 11003]|uniref:Uncharacterized protein n=1 Tax=Thermosyntropha lipolytica DSM 11003 TaxID=1123382 RepID=A0A1M5PT90_9FIRM|nr:hypothetical protein [Thermosyntropha lipolytica]SHH04851.1 hypothetical protein SAMN02745221_01555 [Thermosyntropha lipolytica DSM 11003]
MVNQLKTNPIRTLLVVVLCFIIAVTPAAIGVGLSEIYRGNNEIQSIEIKGIQHEELVAEALANSQVQELMEILIGPNASINLGESHEIKIGELTAQTVSLYAGKENSINIKYANVNGDILVGALVFENSQKIVVYDVIDKKIYNTSVVEIVDNKEDSIPMIGVVQHLKINADKGVRTTWIEGPYAENAISYSKSVELNSTGDFQLLSNNCSWCTHACGIVASLGCGLSAFARCLLLCNVNLVCEGICNAVWIALCYGFVGAIDCPKLCSNMGYCP